MSNRRVFVVSTLVGVVLACSAHAQRPSNLDYLDRLSAQRNAEMRPRPDQPAPVPTLPERIVPTNHQWVCMSTTPWQPVLSAPNPRASVIGQTQQMVAASIGWVNGYGTVASLGVRPQGSPHFQTGPKVSATLLL